MIVPPSPGVLCALGDATTSAARRVGPHLPAPVRRSDRRRAGRDPARPVGRRVRPARRPGRRPPTTSRPPTRSTSATSARASSIPVDVDPAWLDDPDEALADHRRSGSTPSTSGCSPSSCDRRPRAGQRPRRRQRAAPDRRRRRHSSPATAIRLRPAGAACAIYVGRRLAGRRRRTTARCCAPATSSPARRSSTEMDSTTLVLPGHVATVDPSGSLLIRPSARATPSPADRRADHGHASSRRTTPPLEPGRRRPRHAGPRSRTGCATPGTRWTRCCSAPRCRPGIREQHDEFPLIADPSGKMVVGQFGLSIPDFLDGFDGDDRGGRRAAHLRPVRLRRARSATPTTGSWCCPIFHEGRLVGWASMFGHMSDVGGKTPSSMPTDARTIYEEGVVIPPFKLYSAGTLNEDALRDHPQPGPGPGLEPRRPQRPGRRLPDRRPAGPGDVRAVRRRRRTCPRWTTLLAAQLRRHEGAAARGVRGGPDSFVHRLHLTTTASGTARTS